MALTIHDVEQGSQEWLDLRCGILTASTIGQLITPKTVKVANNDTARALTLSLIAERITGHVEPVYVSADMERGTLDEPIARDLYSEHYAPVTEVGFMTATFNGHTLGYSPDGLIGQSGIIEIKSRRQKKQLQTILDDTIPLENMAQAQTGLFVTGREWCDYVSYSGGMPLYVTRVLPDPRWFVAIGGALEQFEKTASNAITQYRTKTRDAPTTERRIEVEDLIF